MSPRFPDVSFAEWLVDYKQGNRSLLDGDEEFARWLEDEYIPIAGGWQY